MVYLYVRQKKQGRYSDKIEKIVGINVSKIYLGKCAPFSPLIQQQSTDSKFKLMLCKGRGSCPVAQTLTMIRYW